MGETKTPKDKLLIVLRKGKADRVGAMLDQFPDELEPNMSADTAENRLLHRAARFGHAEVIKVLVSKGADVGMTNKFGMTALHHGAVHGGADVIQSLLDAGANPNQPDDSGRLPLHWTSTKGHVEGANVLIAGGAKPTGGDNEGFTPLHRCCQEEPQPKAEEEAEDSYKEKLDNAKAEISKILIAKGANLSAMDLKGQQTPLHLSSLNGLVAVTGVLLSAGADFNVTNRIGQTPLIYAVIEQHVAVIKLLNDAGADVNKGNFLHSDWAPLHWAALSDNPRVVEAVLENESVRNVKDASGRYSVTLAEEHGKEKVVEMLANLKKE
jgi:ankyrin repeat protein